MDVEIGNHECLVIGRHKFVMAGLENLMVKMGMVGLLTARIT